MVAATILSGACAAEHEVSTDGVSWSLDSSCGTPSETDRVAIDAALELWADGFGVEVRHGDASADIQITVCLSDDPVVMSSGRRVQGLTTRMDDGSRLIRIDRRSVQFAGKFYTALVAHEIGHALLHGTADEDHLADGQEGIMAPEHTCVGPSNRCEWSDADIDLIEASLH